MEIEYFFNEEDNSGVASDEYYSDEDNLGFEDSTDSVTYEYYFTDEDNSGVEDGISPLDMTIYSYPSNVGNSYTSPSISTSTSATYTSSGDTQSSGHYMIIWANVQRRTQYSYSRSGQSTTIQRNYENLKGGTNNPNQIFSNVNNYYRTNEGFVLHIPDTMVYTNSQQYENFEIGGTIPGLLATGATTATNNYQQYLSGSTSPANAASSILKQLGTSGIATFLNQSSLGRGILQTTAGIGINPLMEIIYSKPDFRSFRFDFNMYPRSKKEAKDLLNIVRRLRFHSSPEIKSDNNFFMIPPSTFDIEFYYNGGVNPNVDSISTCILQSIDVDYAPGGWSTYEDDDNYNVATSGGTGMPTSIRLSLQFKETEYLTKENYLGS